ncbi:hypothetical protein BC834DRAFT_972382 [Gloeopeniophorella convolvens]|nr:hypothetical protein BC834DRAFT_972382 [Gloeopeniophorella convolvens]
MESHLDTNFPIVSQPGAGATFHEPPQDFNPPLVSLMHDPSQQQRGTNAALSVTPTLYQTHSFPEPYSQHYGDWPDRAESGIISNDVLFLQNSDPYDPLPHDRSAFIGQSPGCFLDSQVRPESQQLLPNFDPPTTIYQSLTHSLNPSALASGSGLAHPTRLSSHALGAPSAHLMPSHFRSVSQPNFLSATGPVRTGMDYYRRASEADVLRVQNRPQSASPLRSNTPFVPGSPMQASLPPTPQSVRSTSTQYTAVPSLPQLEGSNLPSASYTFPSANPFSTNAESQLHRTSATLSPDLKHTAPSLLDQGKKKKRKVVKDPKAAARLSDVRKQMDFEIDELYALMHADAEKPKHKKDHASYIRKRIAEKLAQDSQRIQDLEHEVRNLSDALSEKTREVLELRQPLHLDLSQSPGAEYGGPGGLTQGAPEAQANLGTLLSDATSGLAHQTERCFALHSQLESLIP